MTIEMKISRAFEKVAENFTNEMTEETRQNMVFDQLEEIRNEIMDLIFEAGGFDGIDNPEISELRTQLEELQAKETELARLTEIGENWV
ncbi:MAG: hypothetical protein FWG64_02090 [Firmicutes bacterium]|nr:hypothetical protein [Bacillota bacterium]